MRIKKRSKGRFTIEKDLNESFRVRVTEQRAELETIRKSWKTVFMMGTKQYAFVSILLQEEAYPALLIITQLLFMCTDTLTGIENAPEEIAKLLNKLYTEHSKKNLDTDETDDEILAKEQALHESIQKEAATKEGKKAVKKMTKNLEKPNPVIPPKKVVTGVTPKTTPKKEVVTPTTTKKKDVTGAGTKTAQKKDAKTKSN